MTNPNYTEYQTGKFATNVDIVGTISGSYVVVSGTVNTSISGNVVKISGEVVKISGETVIAKISGEIVTVEGLVVDISGAIILVNISGQIVGTSISGNLLGTPSKILTGGLLKVTSASGGVVLSSGVTTSVVVAAKKENAGDIYVGSSGYYPYSGYGLCLSPQDTITMDLNNLNVPYVVSSVSGDMVSFAGTV